MSTTHTALTTEPVTRVDANERVRHVDQLSRAARQGLRALLDGETRPVDELQTGEVVKTTRFVRVVAATAETTVLATTDRARVPAIV